MNRFLIILFFGYVWSEKLDRSYLPPPGASLAGGNPGDIVAPLEIANLPQRGLSGVEEYKPIGQSTVVPITTTSYAFTQTTTFPSIESYESTAVPLDPVTGLPVQNIGTPNYQGQTYPGYDQHEAQNKQTLDNNVQPIFGKQTTLPDGQYINTDNTNFPELGHQLQHVISPGLSNLQQNLEDQFSLDQQRFLQSTSSPQEIKSSRLLGGQYRIGSKITSARQPINVPNIFQNQTNQENKKLIDSQNDIFMEIMNYQPNNLTYAPVGPIYRQERPQAEADRNAVIISYENVRTPVGYSYNFDTSNGIHADENGLVEDGTRAQGSYSYIGDDGKVYSVIYTADENGFQARGDHLPTPPPVPEEIQRIIEKVAREKEFGIVDDGSYNEEKYGYKNYERSMSYRRPQTQKIGNVDNILLDKEQGDIKPIIGLTEYDYEEDEIPNKFSNNEGIREQNNQQPINTQKPRRPLNKITGEGNPKGISVETIKNSEYDQSSTPFSEFSSDKADNDNQLKNIKIQISGAQSENLDFVNNDGQTDNFHNEDKQIVKDVIPGLYRPDQFSTQSDNGIRETTSKNQESNQNGYQYIPPEIQIKQTQLPTRFKERLSMTTKPMQLETRRPFLTPEVYNQPSSKKDIDNYSPSITQKAFVTTQVTPKVNSYNSNDGDKDYSGPDFNSDDINPTRDSNGNIITSTGRPYELTRTEINAQYTPFNQDKHQNTVKAGDVDGIVSSTSRPLTSNIVSTETNKPKQLQYQYKPSYKNNTYNKIQPIFGSPLQFEQSTPTSPNYQSSTYNPFSSTELPINISRFQSNSGISDSDSDSYQKIPFGIYNKKYHHEPIISDQLAPGSYQTTNEQKYVFSSDPVTKLPLSDKTSISVLPNQNFNTPTLAPLEYQTTYQYRPMNPSYTDTTASLTPTIESKFVSPANYGNKFPQKSALGYRYGPQTRPESTISSTSTVGTTPSYIISSTIPGRPFQDYSTTGRPVSSELDTYDHTLVDGFGRRISFDQQPGYPYFGQNLDAPFVRGQEAGSDIKNNLKVFPSTEKPSSDRKYYSIPTVIGEDFSGPKQSQRFDPQTGYYYK